MCGKDEGRSRFSEDNNYSNLKKQQITFWWSQVVTLLGGGWGGETKKQLRFLRAVLHCHVKRGAAAACGGGLVSPRQPHLTACAAVMQLCYA